MQDAAAAALYVPWMAVYVLRRALYSIPVLFCSTFLIFTFVTVAGDPLSTLRMTQSVSDETIQNIVERKHLDDPVPVRYVHWLRDAVTNKFGTTLIGDRPIWPDLRRVMGNTLQLLVAAQILSLVLGIVVGVYAAIRQYSVFDYTATTASFLGLSWLALMVQVLVVNLYLATDVRIFYVAGLNSADPENFVLDRIQHLALPVLVISVGNIALYSRFVRASMLEIVNSDFVRTARAKGLRERGVVFRHALRNALTPLITLAALNLGGLIGGAVIAESIFQLDGMGLFFIQALGETDPYPVMAWLVVTATMIVVANLLADIALAYLDPRVRLT